ncbi:MAG: 16S rRNA (uracil(1498)-N(3))-methyltransferase [Flavobacteriaceae bacterium]|nr:16S rRNA (uracil(1498)-N(3))-methyltransferase [Flavobacteriaceae bacterium]
MNLFYQPKTTKSTTEVHFDKEESRHIGKVLRKKEGDLIQVTNGSGLLLDCELQEVHSKSCRAIVKDFSQQAPMDYQLHMAVAPTKLNDRYEWFLEKATEIGISSITPIICDHSERKVIKPERYEKILISAMKQSLNLYLPVLNEARSFSEFINQAHTEEIRCIAHCNNGNKTSFKNILKPNKSILLLIGPEGDFSNSEVEEALATDFHEVSLGTTRLRTETAAIVGCHSVAFINES